MPSDIQVPSNGNDASVVHDVRIELGIEPTVCHTCLERQVLTDCECTRFIIAVAQAAVAQECNGSASTKFGCPCCDQRAIGGLHSPVHGETVLQRQDASDCHGPVRVHGHAAHLRGPADIQICACQYAVCDLRAFAEIQIRA